MSEKHPQLFFKRVVHRLVAMAFFVLMVLPIAAHAGALSGSYTNQSCNAGCSLPWGGSITHGQSVTAFLSATPTGACTSETRTCTSGTLSGTYTAQTCTAGCASSSQTWNTNCSATATAAAAGGTQSLTNSAGGFSGSATATCNAMGTGSFALSSTSCTAVVNGACGTSNGANVSAAPSTNLCNAGSASGVSGTGPYTWTCTGSGGGSTASCSANRQCTGTPWGTVNHGSSNTAYASSSPAGACTSESRTCTQGSLSGSYTATSCTAGCTGTPWGSVASGYSNTAWNTSASCGGCSSETRTCTAGTLSGTFTNTSCNNSSCAGCSAGATTWHQGATGCAGNCCQGTYGALSHGGSVSISNTSSNWVGSITVTCTNGSVSTSNPICAAPANCSFNAVTVNHGASVTAYYAGSVACGGTCTSETRTCNNGTLSGSYGWSSCSVASCSNCTGWSYLCDYTFYQTGSAGTVRWNNCNNVGEYWEEVNCAPNVKSCAGENRCQYRCCGTPVGTW